MLYKTNEQLKATQNLTTTTMAEYTRHSLTHLTKLQTSQQKYVQFTNKLAYKNRGKHTPSKNSPELEHCTVELCYENSKKIPKVKTIYAI